MERCEIDIWILTCKPIGLQVFTCYGDNGFGGSGGAEISVNVTLAVTCRWQHRQAGLYCVTADPVTVELEHGYTNSRRTFLSCRATGRPKPDTVTWTGPGLQAGQGSSFTLDPTRYLLLAGLQGGIFSCTAATDTQQLTLAVEVPGSLVRQSGLTPVLVGSDMTEKEAWMGCAILAQAVGGA